jgi:hypothetical protein
MYEWLLGWLWSKRETTGNGEQMKTILKTNTKRTRM